MNSHKNAATIYHSPPKKQKGVTNRNSVRLEALKNKSQPKNYAKQNQRNLKGLQKLEKTQSVLLKGLKISNKKIECEVKQDKLNESVIRVKRVDNTDRRDQHKSVECRNSASKSFMIRSTHNEKIEKNNSNYVKMQTKIEQNQLARFEQAINDIHQQVMHEMLDNSQQLKEMVLGLQKKTDSNSSIEALVSQDLFRETTNDILQGSTTHHPNAIKIRPIICKQVKNTKRTANIKNQKLQLINTGKARNSQNCSKHIEYMLNKLRRASKSEYPSKVNLATNKIEVKNQCQSKQTVIDSHSHLKGYTIHIIQKQNKEEKTKLITGCKTIKIPWNQINQFQHSHLKTKKQEFLIDISHKQVPLYDQDDIFGGISVISNKKSITHIPNNQGNIPVQSLKQLFLQFGHHQKLQALGGEDVISKHLILHN